MTGVASATTSQIAIAVSGTTVSIFYFHGTSGTRSGQTVHDLRVIESTDDGSTWGSPTTITTVEQHCLAVAAVSLTEIFYTDYVLSFDGSAKTSVSVDE